MEDALTLANLANQESINIKEELDIQTEKFIELQKKLGVRRTFLYDNDNAVKELKNALKIKKFLIILAMIFIVFSLCYCCLIYRNKLI